MKQPFIVLAQEHRFSKIGTPMIKITFVGAKDRKEYITYIDKPNRNYKHWQHIVANPEHGFVLRNLIVKRHKDRLLIDADSQPIIECEDDNSERILSILQDVWSEQDRTAESDRFSDLFLTKD
jgi:hypothetical protein